MRAILRNIRAAEKLSEENASVRIVAIVSGSETARANWEKRLKTIGPYIFNRDKGTLTLSLLEKTGTKTRQGNFLGTLFAYKHIKEASICAGLPYREFVTLLGMAFGRAERLSPITQAEGNCKSRVKVTPENIIINGTKYAFCALEEALMHFALTAKYFEKKGFRGILDKWGDETEIPSIDLTESSCKDDSFRHYDIIKIISIVGITPDLAKQKDWVVFNKENDIVAQLPRDDSDSMGLLQNDFFCHSRRGTHYCGSGNPATLYSIDFLDSRFRGNDIIGLFCNGPNEKYRIGISLGPIAFSYNVLDIALDVFADEIEAEDAHFDVDPYFLMALAMEHGQAEWERRVNADNSLQALLKRVPDFFEKVQSIKEIFRQRYRRPLNLKVFDFGKDVYWQDIGTHLAMREKFFALNDKGSKGIIARNLSRIPDKRDESGNIIVNSDINPLVSVKDSVIINTVIKGAGSVAESIFIDSEFCDVEAMKAFSVKSARLGKTVLKPKSGLYKSIGIEELILEQGMRHVTVFDKGMKYDLMVSEDTPLRDKTHTYNVPVFNNTISFGELYDRALGMDEEEMDVRRRTEIARIKRIKGEMDKIKPLRFGTSGLRALVSEMTDMECYINTKGFIEFLKEFQASSFKLQGEVVHTIALGGDLRGSTPRIMTAVMRAIEDSACKTDFCGELPSPALMYYAFQKRIPSIMVTGSHIPEDRNGIKFTKMTGEILKEDEEAILRNVLKERELEYAKTGEESLFDEQGMFKKMSYLPAPANLAVDIYIKRYSDVFSSSVLKGLKIAFYQHSAVGRDIIRNILESLGAIVISVERSDGFVPVDTEKISENTETLLRKIAEEHKPFAVISTDGDSDRPLLSDETGKIVPGDKLGLLVCEYLKPNFAAVPISVNDGVVNALKERNIRFNLTKIGSPYVIKAMNKELEKNPASKVVSWESNGGFLLGSDWPLNGRVLRALPTRDAVLAIVSVLVLAKQEEKKISELVCAKLPKRYSYSGVVDNKTKGCEHYTSDTGKTIVKMFSPKQGAFAGIDFTKEGKHIWHEDGQRGIMSLEIKKDLDEIRERISGYFSKKAGFGDIVSMNFVDGIRMTFSGNDIVHLRPSGNAPEFRIYAVADSLQKARNLIKKTITILTRLKVSS